MFLAGDMKQKMEQLSEWPDAGSGSAALQLYVCCPYGSIIDNEGDGTGVSSLIACVVILQPAKLSI